MELSPMSNTLHSVAHLLASAFNFFCNPLSPRRHLTTRIWLAAVVTFTVSTTVFMLGCVCTHQWEITTYDYRLLNHSIHESDSEECSFTETKYFGDGLVIITTDRRRASNRILSPSTDNRSEIADKRTSASASCPDEAQYHYQNVSLAYRQYGNAFSLCLDVDEQTWVNISRLCAPRYIDRCLYYTPSTVKSPFCCKNCLYTHEEVQELDEDGFTTFEPIFTVIGFLIVCLVVLCACHVLALIALWKRLVPVVMFTGILFLVSGTFMAFCLAAHQYKVSVMNMKRRSLPHLTHEMSLSSRTHLGWSVDAGWMGFALSVLTGILWIRFSFHLASETTYNKIRPTIGLLHGSSPRRAASMGASSLGGAHGVALDSGQSVANGYAASGLPKTVRWANSAKKTASATPNSRPTSAGRPPTSEQQYGKNGMINQTTQHDAVKLPMMVEEAV